MSNVTKFYEEKCALQVLSEANRCDVLEDPVVIRALVDNKIEKYDTPFTLISGFYNTDNSLCKTTFNSEVGVELNEARVRMNSMREIFKDKVAISLITAFQIAIKSASDVVRNAKNVDTTMLNQINVIREHYLLNIIQTDLGTIFNIESPYFDSDVTVLDTANMVIAHIYRFLLELNISNIDNFYMSYISTLTSVIYEIILHEFAELCVLRKQFLNTVSI